MSIEKCPYCYRILQTWLHDPILLSTGAAYKWFSDTVLEYVPNIEDRIYKGIYQIREDEVKEIQDMLKTLESENLPVINRTEFSPLNTSGFFQITGKHIKEMRDSIEKLLNIFGLTKTNYFNYDLDGNHIIHPNGDKLEWTDPITISTDLNKFQVKYVHIEDLRHYVAGMEIWNIGSTSSLYIASFFDRNTFLDKSFFPESYFRPYLAMDLTYFYVGEDKYIHIISKNTFTQLIFVTIPHIGAVIHGITIDTNYIWVIYRKSIAGTYHICQIDKITYTIISDDFMGILPIYNAGASGYGVGFICDKDYLYIKAYVIGSGYSTILKIDKISKVIISYNYGDNTFIENGLGIDSNYLYVFGRNALYNYGFYSINLDLTIKAFYPVTNNFSNSRVGIISGQNNIYMIAVDGKLMAYNKTGTFIWSTTTLNGGSIVGSGRYNEGSLASLTQYNLTT